MGVSLATGGQGGRSSDGVSRAFQGPSVHLAISAFNTFCGSEVWSTELPGCGPHGTKAARQAFGAFENARISPPACLSRFRRPLAESSDSLQGELPFDEVNLQQTMRGQLPSLLKEPIEAK